MPESLLDQISLFQELSPKQRSLMEPLFVSCAYTHGETIFLQDSPAEYIYILATGRVVLRFKPYDGSDLTVARLEAGGVFGWSAVIGSVNYTSSAICSEDYQLLQLRGADLQRFCNQHPETGMALLECLAHSVSERLHYSRAQVISLLEYGINKIGITAEDGK